MLIALVDKKRRGVWLIAAFLLLVLGTAASFGAVITGEEAEHIIGAKTQAIKTAIHDHEETAEMARNLFIVVTVLFAITLILRAKLTNPENPKKKKPAVIVGGLLIAITYTLGALALANASHQGGILVHDLGLHAPIGTTAPAPQLNEPDDD